MQNTEKSWYKGLENRHPVCQVSAVMTSLQVMCAYLLVGMLAMLDPISEAPKCPQALYREPSDANQKIPLKGSHA